MSRLKLALIGLWSLVSIDSDDVKLFCLISKPGNDLCNITVRQQRKSSSSDSLPENAVAVRGHSLHLPTNHQLAVILKQSVTL